LPQQIQTVQPIRIRIKYQENPEENPGTRKTQGQTARFSESTYSFLDHLILLNPVTEPGDRPLVPFG